MRAGLIGAGKLGMPVAVAFAQKHEVLCYDKSTGLMRNREYEHREQGYGGKSFQELFDESCDDKRLQFSSLPNLVAQSEIIFVVVQTPHGSQYEGVTRLPEARADFDYTYLKEAVKEIVTLAKYHTSPKILAIISTVLPGTIRREILPITQGIIPVVYNPAFAAMGTVVQDVLNPEFVLLGGLDEEQEILNRMSDFYYEIIPREVLTVHISLESAELTKMGYNGLITLKTVLANTLGDIASKIPHCNVDHVTNTLKMATRRLISPSYLDAGVGDGGACHPRDNISLSYLSRKLDLGYDLFGDLMYYRQRQAERQASLIRRLSRERNLSVVILGKGFKPESAITTGSYALLLANLLTEYGVKFAHWDPYVDANGEIPFAWGIEEKPEAGIFFLATKHQLFSTWTFPAGSIVIDPFRYVPKQEGVEVLQLGVGQ